MNEAFAALGRFRAERVLRQRGNAARQNADRVDLRPYADRRGRVDAGVGDDGQVRGERLAVDLPLAVAVERVAADRSDVRDLQMLSPSAYFLVAGEDQA